MTNTTTPSNKQPERANGERSSGQDGRVLMPGRHKKPMRGNLHDPVCDHTLILSAYSKKNRTQIAFQADSPYTDQSFKEEADINTIMKRYQSTGELPVLDDPSNNFLDVSDYDFTEHMNAVTEAREMFAALPSTLRDRFYNSPAHFLDFVENPRNRTELAELGLLTEEATRAILNPPKTE